MAGSMNTIDPGGGARHDVVVVLARGESRRFGAPKALARHGADSRPLLRRVVDAYRAWNPAPILVVTSEGLLERCTGCVEDLPGVRVISGPPGGDTARSLAMAWRGLVAAGTPCTHVWAHPVDLPWLRPRTLAQLARVSCAAPLCTVRPTWSGHPGHPLIMPAELLARLVDEAAGFAGPWRRLLEREVTGGRIPAPVLVPVADPGTVLDLDVPQSGAGAAPGS